MKTTIAVKNDDAMNNSTELEKIKFRSAYENAKIASAFKPVSFQDFLERLYNGSWAYDQSNMTLVPILRSDNMHVFKCKGFEVIVRKTGEN